MVEYFQNNWLDTGLWAESPWFVALNLRPLCIIHLALAAANPHKTVGLPLWAQLDVLGSWRENLWLIQFIHLLLVGHPQSPGTFPELDPLLIKQKGVNFY